MQDRIYSMLVNEDELTWQSIIYDLVKTEELDPWDIDLSRLSQQYLEKIKELQEHNFFISGKVVLAASILLKIKSVKLLDEHIADFDSLLFQKEEDLLADDFEEHAQFHKDAPGLLIKTPQSRKRKINLQDLMDALHKALEVENRRILKREDDRVIREIPIPVKKIDISSLIKHLYARIKEFFTKKQQVTFSELIPSEKKEDKILTFLPLLHLSNQGKISLHQEKSFGEILITEETE